MSDNLKFNHSNGVVTKLWEWDDGRWERETIDQNETWTYESGQLIKKEWEHGRLETEIYTDSNKDGIFIKEEDDGEDLEEEGEDLEEYDEEEGDDVEGEEDDGNDENSDNDETQRDEVDAEDSGMLDLDIENSFEETTESLEDPKIKFVVGKKREDQLIGSALNDEIKGGKGDDFLRSRRGDDYLYGGRGDDYLDGGRGDDIMTGGKGADKFRVSKGDDTIKDFQLGVDSFEGLYKKYHVVILETGDTVIEHKKGSILLEGLQLTADQLSI